MQPDLSIASRHWCFGDAAEHRVEIDLSRARAIEDENFTFGIPTQNNFLIGSGKEMQRKVTWLFAELDLGIDFPERDRNIVVAKPFVCFRDGRVAETQAIGPEFLEL